jgi:hypothetical protein
MRATGMGVRWGLVSGDQDCFVFDIHIISFPGASVSQYDYGPCPDRRNTRPSDEATGGWGVRRATLTLVANRARRR